MQETLTTKREKDIICITYPICTIGCEGDDEMKDNKLMDDKFMGSVKIGTKGQIVIPREVRAMFNLNPGDTLIVLADPERGIAIKSFEKYNDIFEKVFCQKK